jgi:hypothetical protein
VEEHFQIGWDVFQEGENLSVWMFVSKNVEYEPLFGCESVSVCRSPAFEGRFEAPRYDEGETLKNLLHKAITLKARTDRAS